MQHGVNLIPPFPPHTQQQQEQHHQDKYPVAPYWRSHRIQHLYDVFKPRPYNRSYPLDCHSAKLRKTMIITGKEHHRCSDANIFFPRWRLCLPSLNICSPLLNVYSASVNVRFPSVNITNFQDIITFMRASDASALPYGQGKENSLNGKLTNIHVLK